MKMRKRKIRKCLHYTRTVFIPLIMAMMGVLFWAKAMNNVEWLILSPKHVAFGCVVSLGLIFAFIYADETLSDEDLDDN